MAEVIRIALTGGACSGKTKAFRYISKTFNELGIDHIFVEDSRSKLTRKGKTPDKYSRYDYYKMLFEEQLALEKKAFKDACSIRSKRVVVISDGGLLDSRAFVTKSEFDRYAGLNGTSEEIIRNSYDAVFHMVTTAKGAEDFYYMAQRATTSNTVEFARRMDEEILSVWVGTPHLRVLDNSTDFRQKVKRLVAEMTAFIGVPEPYEIERKFLIAYPSLDMLSKMKACRKIPITQAYLKTKKEGKFRIRKRGDGENAVYIKTIKKKINDLKRIEVETYISKKDYDKYLSDVDSVNGIITKDRYCFVWKSSYYELDVYPFWNDKATLEIELISENQPYEIPDFIELIREVSAEPEYRNSNLAFMNINDEL